jgi:hypothetical protein
VAFFNLVPGVKLDEQEKRRVVPFTRALRSGGAGEGDSEARVPLPGGSAMMPTPGGESEA